MDDCKVHLGLLTVDVSLPASFSLNDKRRILRGLMDKLRSRGNLSVAEIGYADAHTRSVIVVAYVNGDRAQAERVLSEAERIVASRDGLVVNDALTEWR